MDRRQAMKTAAAGVAALTLPGAASVAIGAISPQPRRQGFVPPPKHNKVRFVNRRIIKRQERGFGFITSLELRQAGMPTKSLSYIIEPGGFLWGMDLKSRRAFAWNCQGAWIIADIVPA